MRDNHMEIKERQKDWLLKGFLYLGLMIVSLIFTFIPLFSGIAGGVLFYILGGVAFAACTTLFVLLLYKVCNPSTAIVLTARGFTDKKNVGERIEIEWTNVSAIKQLGKKEMPFLGISLENPDIILSQMRTKEAEIMRDNLDENLPAILIAQNEIAMPIKEMKELFTKFAREARALENQGIAKTKNNPFSSQDVLDNFQNANTPTQEKLYEPTPPEDLTETLINDAASEPENVIQEVQEETVITNNFYEELLKQAEMETVSTPEPTETKEIEPEIENIILPDIFEEKEEETTVSDNEKTIVFSDEFTEILNNAKATKISELDKLLNDDTSSVKKSDTYSNNNDKKADTNSIGISELESMIENALLNVEVTEKENEDIDPIPVLDFDLDKIVNESQDPESKKTKKKKAFVLSEKK